MYRTARRIRSTKAPDPIDIILNDKGLQVWMVLYLEGRSTVYVNIKFGIYFQFINEHTRTCIMYTFIGK